MAPAEHGSGSKEGKPRRDQQGFNKFWAQAFSRWFNLMVLMERMTEDEGGLEEEHLVPRVECPLHEPM